MITFKDATSFCRSFVGRIIIGSSQGDNAVKRRINRVAGRQFQKSVPDIARMQWMLDIAIVLPLGHYHVIVT